MSFNSSDRIYSEPFNYSRPRPEPQSQQKSSTRRRGDEIHQIQQSVATNLGNGQIRIHPVQQQQQQMLIGGNR